MIVLRVCFYVCNNAITPQIEREIEVKEHEKKVERLNSEVTELGKANLSLERRLRESNEERDVLSLQSVELLASKHSYKGQLDVTQEHLTQLTSTIMLKTEENEQLKEKLKTVEEELEITKFLVSACYAMLCIHVIVVAWISRVYCNG